MKRLLITIIALLCLCNCSVVADSRPINKVHREKARVTFYSNDPKWGKRVACQKTKYATEGITVAAHPKYKFGTKLFIPKLKGVIGDGIFVVQDRGGAVTRKVASNGKAFVFDVYVSSHSKIQKLKTKVPDYLEVQVLEK